MQQTGKKEYETRYDGIEMVTNWWRPKIGNAVKWYLNRPDSVLQNGTNEILRDFAEKNKLLNLYQKTRSNV